MVTSVRGIELVSLTPEVFVARDPDGASPPTASLWSGAMAFRTRWNADRVSLGWTTEGCPGSHDEGGDVLRFDPVTRTVRETWLTRPRTVIVDAALLEAIAHAPVSPGALSLPAGTPDFVLPSTTVALFDLTLGCYAALIPAPDGTLPPPSAPLRALPVSPDVALMVLGGQYVGWRVTDPVAHVRPMGWPEPRMATPPTGELRARLTALVYDWMTLDAAPRPRPDEAADPEDIAHLIGLRDRARALADVCANENDPTPGVARDIAAHIHWSWGFFRLADTADDR